MIHWDDDDDDSRKVYNDRIFGKLALCDTCVLERSNCTQNESRDLLMEKKSDITVP